MSLTSVLNNAVSGLNVAQAQLRNTSNNITNINTPDYARKVTEVSSRALDGQGAGVEVGEVRRIVDEYLQREMRAASGDSERYRAMSELHDRLQSLLGDPNKSSTYAVKIDDLFSSLASLSSDPAQQARRLSVISDLRDLGTELSRIATDLQELRAEADRQIETDISTANAAIARIHDLNQQIQRERIAGRETGALEDQREAALSDISKVLDIHTFALQNGAVGVATSSGVPLVDNVRYELVYAKQSFVGAETQFPQIVSYRLDPATGARAINGTPLDTRVRAGSIKGLLDMRDTALPAIAAELGELARVLGDRLNAVHNEFTAVPAPADLEGTNTGLAATDLQGFSGQATFYAFDAAGAVASSFVMDFSALAPGSTIADVVAAVNAGLGGSASLGFANGVMTYAAGTAAGVAIQQGTPPSDRAGRGFAHFFGLNDLVGAAVPLHHDTGLVAADAHGFTGIVTLDVRAPGNAEPASHTLDFGVIGGQMSDVLTALNGSPLATYFSFSLDGDGALVATPQTGAEGYRLEPSSDSSDRAGTGRSFTDVFGIGAKYQVNAALDFAPRSDIEANGRLLALARVDAAGNPAIASGDNRGALALQAVSQGEFDFAAAGDFGLGTARIQDYAGRILSVTGQRAADAEAIYNDRNALSTELLGRSQDVSGVNLDEELSNMILYQNAYNASARLITTAREMLDVLLRIA